VERAFGRSLLESGAAGLRFGRHLSADDLTSTFSALGGIRTPNLLIRSKVRLSQWVPSVPAGYNQVD
jgi:hypothetical protein